jgi:hypothetical protein
MKRRKKTFGRLPCDVCHEIRHDQERKRSQFPAGTVVLRDVDSFTAILPHRRGDATGARAMRVFANSAAELEARAWFFFNFKGRNAQFRDVESVFNPVLPRTLKSRR